MAHRAKFEIRVPEVDDKSALRTIFRAYVHDGFPSNFGEALSQFLATFQSIYGERYKASANEPSLLPNFLIHHFTQRFLEEENQYRPVFYLEHPDEPMMNNLEFYYFLDFTGEEWRVAITVPEQVIFVGDSSSLFEFAEKYPG